MLYCIVVSLRNGLKLCYCSLRGVRLFSSKYCLQAIVQHILKTLEAILYDGGWCIYDLNRRLFKVRPSTIMTIGYRIAIDFVNQ